MIVYDHRTNEIIYFIQIFILCYDDANDAFESNQSRDKTILIQCNTLDSFERYKNIYTFAVTSGRHIRITERLCILNNIISVCDYYDACSRALLYDYVDVVFYARPLYYVV